MKPTTRLSLLALSTSSALLASAQQNQQAYLSNTQYGALPACADTCPALTGPQSTCGSDDWACFCSGVWAQIQSAPTQVCAQTCSNPADVATASQWYTANCGSDNGATAHPAGAATSGGNSGSGNGNGSSGNGGNGNGNNGGSSGSGSPDGSSSSSSSSDSSDESGGNQGWFAGHWRWVVMIIVLFIGLILLALLGTWLKRRHHRKRDQISGGFNSGITERAPHTASNPNMSQHNIDASVISSNPALHDTINSTGGRDSPVRTRDAFMPYGYGYARSESRLGSHPDNLGRASSPLARGATPVDTIERGEAASPVGGAGAGNGNGNGKKTAGGRRVLVRERSGADSSEDVTR